MHCSAEMPLRAEHCPRCGQRSYANFDMLAESVHEDAAVRRGLRIEDALRWAVAALVLICAVFYAFNDFFDKPLTFDGSAVPSIPAGVVSAPQVPQIDKGYSDPHPPPSMPGRAPHVFGYRSEPIRNSLLAANGGATAPDKTRGVHDAIDLGLKFLAHSQSADGSFPVEANPKAWAGFDTLKYEKRKMEVTSLAVLAFLGDGETWLEHDTKKPLYEKQVRAAVKWMAQNQGPDGLFGPGFGDGLQFMYNHGVATLAMCEVAGLTGDEYLRQSAQKGIDYIVKSQNTLNGWNHFATQPGGDADTSVSAWQVQALYAAREAGLNVPDDTMKRALEMFRKATQQDGQVVYSIGYAPEKTFNPSLCGIGLMMREMLGDDPHAPIFKAMAQKIVQALPKTQASWGEGWSPNTRNDNDLERHTYDPYMMYFCTYGVFMLGGKEWDLWQEGMKRSMIEMQSNDGCWRCNDYYGTVHLGMIYSTALSVLTLQVYYRIR